MMRKKITELIVGLFVITSSLAGTDYRETILEDILMTPGGHRARSQKQFVNDTNPAQEQRQNKEIRILSQIFIIITRDKCIPGWAGRPHSARAEGWDERQSRSSATELTSVELTQSCNYEHLASHRREIPTGWGAGPRGDQYPAGTTQPRGNSGVPVPHAPHCL
ncbi:unnamed protein product [Chrysodeixis includens]|uniref:Uncharacterized protein n=1 Tax=Chrysodeixis includens TaxID=689277 RepID=A0A9N8Q108_CHRIL|nr:unnamed protein product [Chrysodeixis includens]